MTNTLLETLQTCLEAGEIFENIVADKSLTSEMKSELITALLETDADELKG